jgi:hypothetical protein
MLPPSQGRRPGLRTLHAHELEENRATTPPPGPSNTGQETHTGTNNHSTQIPLRGAALLNLRTAPAKAASIARSHIREGIDRARALTPAHGNEATGHTTSRPSFSQAPPPAARDATDRVDSPTNGRQSLLQSRPSARRGAHHRHLPRGQMAARDKEQGWGEVRGARVAARVAQAGQHRGLFFWSR